MAQASSSISQLLGFISGNQTAYDNYYSNPKGFLDPENLSTLKSQMLTDSDIPISKEAYANQVNSSFSNFDPSGQGYNQLKFDYDKYLQGSQVGNSPANTRPLYSSATNQWYDYAGNKWRDIGDGWGESKTPESPAPTDPNKPVTPRKREGYSYGADNPYLMSMLGLSAPVKESQYSYNMRKPKNNSGMDINNLLATRPASNTSRLIETNRNIISNLPKINRLSKLNSKILNDMGY
jgi:hypothetical protein